MLERVAGIAMLSLGISDGFGATSVRAGSAIFRRRQMSPWNVIPYE